MTDAIVSASWEDGQDKSVAIRRYDGPTLNSQDAKRPGFVRAQVTWLYTIVGLDTLLDDSGRPAVLLLVAKHRRLVHSWRVVVSSGLIPISLEIRDKVGSDGLVSVVAIVHLVAVSGLSDVEFELFDGARRLGREPEACFLGGMGGEKLELPCSITRYIDDSYLLVRSRAEVDWGKRTGAWARVSIRSNTGDWYRVSWRASETR